MSRLSSGQRTYRLYGKRIHVTPWVFPFMDADTVRLITAQMLLSGVDAMSISAVGPRGPFMARAGDWAQTRGVTPLDAAERLLDQAFQAEQS